MAFDSCETTEQSEQPRAAFLTKSSINSAGGCDAAKEGLLPRSYLKREAPWHLDVSRTLQKIDPSISYDSESLDDHSLDYKLDTSLDGPIQIQDEAQRKLSLDLFLATDVYAPQAWTSVAAGGIDALETMSRAAEALTLGDEPPSVGLGYLRLRKGVSSNPPHHILRTDSPATQDFDGPLAVRLLLNEWSIGADPENYAYTDPYEEESQQLIAVHRRRQETVPPIVPGTLPPFRLQVPPMVVASKPTAPPIVGVGAPVRAMPTWNTIVFENPTQPSRPPAPRTGSQMVSTDASQPPSQQLLPSTQVLPGPFGGRQAGKKKPVKKRLGGF